MLWARSFWAFSPFLNHIRSSLSLSHAARYSERSSDSGQNADGYLQNCFPRVRFHFFLNVEWFFNVEC